MKTTTRNTAPRFHYIRNRDPKLLHRLKNGDWSRGQPLACVASRVDWTNGSIEYGIATVHSKADTFNYSSGRRVALGRLTTTPLEISFDNCNRMPNTSLEILRLIMLDVVADKATPTRVSRAAKAWLKFKSSIEVALTERDTVRALPSADPLDELVPEARQLTPVKRVPRFAVNYER